MPSRKPSTRANSSDRADSSRVTSAPCSRSSPPSPHRTLQSNWYIRALLPDLHLEADLRLLEVELAARPDPFGVDRVPGAVLPHVLQAEVQRVAPFRIVLAHADRIVAAAQRIADDRVVGRRRRVGAEARQ